jgi:dolichol-phosphate mannosyltransferase
MQINKKLLSIVIPIFNEQDTLSETFSRLLDLYRINSSLIDFEFIFVDDGSTDYSYTKLKQFSSEKNFVKVIKLTRNFGHQIAITAGLDYSTGDYVAIIDGDLQDPPELIIDMIVKIEEGYEIVYGKRISRQGETVSKKLAAYFFYRILNYLCSINIPTDTGDFRVMTRRCVDQLLKMPERHRFIRGMIPWLGFRSYAFEYKRAQRFAGNTKFPASKMINFALNAIFSFSIKPLTIAIKIGLSFLLLSILWGCFTLYNRLVLGSAIPGYTAILLAILMVGGIQIIILGILGQYIGKIYEESKNRPLYIVDSIDRV